MKKFFENLTTGIIFIAFIWIVSRILRDIMNGAEYVVNIFSSVGNVINSVGMFFVNIFAKIVSFFSVIINGPAWLLGKVGTLLAPIFEVIPDSPIISIAVFLLLGTLFMLLKRPDTTLTQTIFDKYVKRTYAWCFTAINLGMVIAGSGNPRIWMSGAMSAYVLDVPMTLLNMAEWTGFARTMLNLTLIGGIIVSIGFALSKDIRYFTRTWVGLAFCCMLGYGYMNVRLIVTDWLGDTLGFIGRILNIPIGLVDYLILLQIFFGIVVFLLPLEVLKVINGSSQNSAAASGRSANPSGSTDDDFSNEHADHFPAVVIDNLGETWEKQYGDNEKAEYRCRKNGARTTIWHTGGSVNLPSGWRAN